MNPKKGRIMNCEIIELVDANNEVCGYEITNKDTNEKTVRMLEIDYDHEGKLEYETRFI